MGQEAAEIQKVKGGGQKKMQTWDDSTPMRPGPAELADFINLHL